MPYCRAGKQRQKYDRKKPLEFLPAAWDSATTDYDEDPAPIAVELPLPRRTDSTTIPRKPVAAVPDGPKLDLSASILGSDGKRLSKRHGAVSVMQYRDEGYLPEALLNYLVRLGWSHGDQEVFSLDEMIELGFVAPEDIIQHGHPNGLRRGEP